MYKVQIESWHEDGWESLTGVNEVHSAEDAAVRAVEKYICESAHYEKVGREPIAVRVDDGKQITTWDVETRATFEAEAKQRP
jgi:hypothetical protein